MAEKPVTLTPVQILPLLPIREKTSPSHSRASSYASANREKPLMVLWFIFVY